jgi:DNA polymerase-3 subunit epsilon
MEEFHRCKMYPLRATETKVIDSKAIFFAKERRDLQAAVKFYCGKDHSEAHSAKADVLATIDVLKHQLLRYDDLKPNTSFLHDYITPDKALDFSGWFIRDDSGEIIFNQGKHKGKKASLDTGYLDWIINKTEFPVDTRTIAQRILRNLGFENHIRGWLSSHKILKEKETAYALYTAVKFKKDIKPFAIKQDNGVITITDETLINNPLLLVNTDAEGILLNTLAKNMQIPNEQIAKRPN